MSEPFAFGAYIGVLTWHTLTTRLEIAWDTEFEQLEKLRSYMLAFLKDESRDFLPVFDVTVDSE